MLQFFLPIFVLAIGVGIGYQAFIAPRRWMKKYGDGNYNPLRAVYKKAGRV